MIMTERIFVMVFASGAVMFGALIAWTLLAPGIRRHAPMLRRKNDSGGRRGSRRGIV